MRFVLFCLDVYKVAREDGHLLKDVFSMSQDNLAALFAQLFDIDKYLLILASNGVLSKLSKNPKFSPLLPCDCQISIHIQKRVFGDFIDFILQATREYPDDNVENYAKCSERLLNDKRYQIFPFLLAARRWSVYEMKL